MLMGKLEAMEDTHGALTTIAIPDSQCFAWEQYSHSGLVVFTVTEKIVDYQ